MQKIKDYSLDTIVILFLSIHLFITHSKLLLHLNPDRIIEKMNYTLTMELFSVGYRVSTLTSIVFSLITAYVLARFVKYKNLFIPVVVSFAILDGLGVIIYYDVNIEEQLFRSFGAFYYGIYTSVLIVCYGIYRANRYKEADLNNNIDKAINESDVIQLRGKMNKDHVNDALIYTMYNVEKLSQQKINIHVLLQELF